MVYIINKLVYPPSCLPEGLDITNFLDITGIGDSWKIYLNPQTGKEYNGADYYEKLQNQIYPE